MRQVLPEPHRKSILAALRNRREFSRREREGEILALGEW